MKHTMLTFFVLCGLLLSMGVVTQATTPEEYCADSEEAVMLKLVNDFRAENGLGPLALTKALGAAADHKSNHMAELDYFEHDGPGGWTPQKNLTNHGYDLSRGSWAENIAAGNADAAATFLQWKNSPGHRANMLQRNMKAIGIGRAFQHSSRYDWYWTQTFGSNLGEEASSCNVNPTPVLTPPASPEPTLTPEPGWIYLKCKPGRANEDGQTLKCQQIQR